ncbi:MAG: cysteine-rich CWC family protein [Candidatus Pristimantibacillus lignocellulolyticus]|uniref:Cysteine-rich CWC family protein n=1 Tax=Candidatus Pristimantibacillus lignocellulolyticus TaxID=2994561 RepID=A0A9J6ZKD3_9BACL|nr:MAG: cysteine-rich CWC family protein [Candidatus Pristimantibacillus lignocellulolyticus]
MSEVTANKCPICSNDNKCGNLANELNEKCWCSKEYFSKEVLTMIPANQLGKSCICKDCLDKYNNLKT